MVTRIHLNGRRIQDEQVHSHIPPTGVRCIREEGHHNITEVPGWEAGPSHGKPKRGCHKHSKARLLQHHTASAPTRTIREVPRHHAPQSVLVLPHCGPTGPQPRANVGRAPDRLGWEGGHRGRKKYIGHAHRLRRNRNRRAPFILFNLLHVHVVGRLPLLLLPGRSFVRTLIRLILKARHP